MPIKNYIQPLSHFFWYCLWLSLPLSKAFLSVSVTALVILGLLHLVLERSTSTNSFSRFDFRPIVYLSVLYLVYVTSCLYSDNTQESIKWLSRSSGLLLVPLAVVWQYRLLLQHYKSYLGAFIGATLVASLATLLLYVLPENITITISEQLSGIFLPYNLNNNRMSFGLYSPFLDRLQLGNLVSLSLLSLVWLWNNLHKKSEKTAAWVALLVLGITQLLLGARAAQLSLFFSMSGLLLVVLAQKIYHRQRWSKQNTILITALGLGVVMVLLPYLSYRYITPFQYRYHQLQWEMEQVWNNDFQQSDYQHFTSLRRLVSWQHTWTLTKQHLIVGVGVGDYYDELQKIYDNDSLDLPINSHSQYLQIWAAVGLVGLIAFLWSLAYWWWALQQKAKLRLAAFGSAVLLYYLIAFVFDAFLLRQIENTVFPLFLASIYVFCYLPIGRK